MIYRKCNLCGHVNENVNETTTKCSECNILFEPTYEEWKIKHPHKSFDDFTRKYCMSENSVTRLKKRRKVLYIAGSIIFVALFIVLQKWNRSSNEQLVHNIKTQLDKVSFKWEHHTFKDIGVSFDAPFSLSPLQVNLADEQKKMINWMKIYSYQSTQNNSYYEVSAMSGVFSERNSSFTETTMLTNMESNFTLNPNILNFKCKIDKAFVANRKCTSLKGSYVNQNLTCDITIYAFLEDKQFWQIMFVHNAGNDSLKGTSNRIIESLRINE